MQKLNDKKTYIFPIFAAHLEESETGIVLSENLLSEMKVHLLSVEQELSRYFPDLSNKFFPLVKSSFTFDVTDRPEIAQEERTEVVTRKAIRLEFVFFVNLILYSQARGLSNTPEVLLPFKTT
jgi:hypothetical protein